MLGLILGAKIFIDFTKYTFDISMDKLKKEIMQEPSFKKFEQSKNNWKVLEQGLKSSSIVKYISQISSEASVLKVAVANTNSDTVVSPKEWSKEKVQEWLSKHNINPEILSLVKDFNGEMICELNSIRTTASEYFYSSISKKNKIELNEVRILIIWSYIDLSVSTNSI